MRKGAIGAVESRILGCAIEYRKLVAQGEILQHQMPTGVKRCGQAPQHRDDE
jgi:hypothetical protein